MSAKPQPHAHCAYCGRAQSECGPLSYRHICRDCGTKAVVTNALQISERRGEYARRRIEAEARSVVERAKAVA